MLLLDLLVFTVKFKTIFSFSLMLTNLLCKAAVPAVLLNNNRKSSSLNEADLCPHPTVKSAAGNRVKKEKKL